ncbi:hypothetical protein A2875_05470 [Candidatus Gottesmanbacteria bacterium RIFCSPHIGHO2_01_FULL_46_14]|uniref:Uncharacterized protein n=2 Tax=Candidatus Gottesmaniibacteriota TaxID=1752720 RepID=A0A1F5ZJR0_9BACT|nr:MAG: hypothetical protein A2875_05470 [Candidatus Gottesmanbacteria bacterium RIFCSPHIGHO2_01_FULL_46_14]OGG28599.1 MAG: hypothetical protein A2971_01765 [Candidatus Gottesmanbacteria bacterium RIFCSPLOWO2_01_FULL_46_21]
MDPLVAYHRAGIERGALNLREVGPQGSSLRVSGFRAEVRPCEDGVELQVSQGLFASVPEGNRFPYVYRAPDGEGKTLESLILLPGERVCLRRPRGKVIHTIGALAPQDGRLALQQIAAMRAA